ncbi:MAG: ABC transporter substrate-binding protein [Bauldia sp.]|uniref:ABC transporter substrate-binding protein n=1 Tax=Bauldia sp. TaxID=2575872 RepID=UPI001DABE950|nr:ABC transporter substrate-binding protein [Bauldia sp.]MCB1494794.1 ABC transporter substrate-binding protein [Bauldia sp.]
MHRPLGYLALLAALAMSCGASAEPDVVLGAVYNLTGSQAGLDIPSSRGARLAADEANRKGGVLGRMVDLVVVDGETAPEVIVERTGALFDTHPMVTALLGLSDTDMLLAAAPVAARHGRLFVTSGATSPELPAEVPTYLFLACFGDNVQAAAGAEWAYGRRGARTAVVLFNATMSYAQLLHGYFETRFRELGGKVLLSRGYAPGSYDEALADLPAADIIYVAAGPEDAVAMTALIRQNGIATPVLGGDGFDSEGPWQGHPDIDAVYFTTHAYLGADNTDPKVIAFRDAFAKAYPGDEPDAFAALGYDTVNLLLAAVARAGSDDPADVLSALPGVRLEGVTGSLSYQDGSRIPTKSVSIVEISGGARHFLGSLLPTRIPPP